MEGSSEKHELVRSQQVVADGSGESTGGQTMSTTAGIKRARSFELESVTKVSRSASFAVALLQKGGQANKLNCNLIFFVWTVHLRPWNHCGPHRSQPKYMFGGGRAGSR
eukprot:1632012-Amphidinium_carterae.2